MSSTYYVLPHAGGIRPMSADDIKRALATSQLRPTDLVRRDQSEKSWRTLAEEFGARSPLVPFDRSRIPQCLIAFGIAIAGYFALFFQSTHPWESQFRTLAVIIGCATIVCGTIGVYARRR